MLGSQAAEQRRRAAVKGFAGSVLMISGLVLHQVTADHSPSSYGQARYVHGVGWLPPDARILRIRLTRKGLAFSRVLAWQLPGPRRRHGLEWESRPRAG